MDGQRIKRFLQFDTAGWIALSGLLLCTLSGILLAIPYDFVHAHRSVLEMLLLNPPALFVRNVHYWSAQLFFIFTLLHIYDHLSKSTETNIKSARTWRILSFVILFLGYEMISGFVLKGDASGLQARRIVASLLESVPFAGRMLSAAFTGNEDQWLVVYVQHVATGTLFLFVGVYEHLRTRWPKPRTFLLVALILLALSLLFRAPLGLADSSQLKGPWFFVGVQEMLHQTSHPGYVMLLFFLLLLLFLFLTGKLKRYSLVIKRIFLTGMALYLLLTFWVLLFRGENWQLRGWKDFARSEEQLLIFDPVNPLKQKPQLLLRDNQKAEGCLLCHSSMKGLTESHNPASTGCYACHKGDPYSSDKTVAHSNMVKIPGDLSNARQTCGTANCHADIAGRVEHSLMNTQSGIVAVDKFVFGESASLNDTFKVANLSHSAADTHLRNLCAGCHLGKEKVQPGNAAWLERGGGCNACHLHYSDQALASMKKMQARQTGSEEVHPSLDLQIPDDRCKSCHSRSGRISLNYEGWNETDRKPSEVKPDGHFSVLPDDRVVELVQDDVHHRKGLACIDCHSSYETMGDGQHPAHKEEAVKVQCADCHPAGKPATVSMADLPDRESQLIAGLRKYNPKKRVVLTADGNRPLLNVQVDTVGQLVLVGKLTGQIHSSKPQAAACNRGKAHSRLSCGACHTAWVPQCIGCHNRYEKETAGFDMLTGRPVNGSWVEFAGKSLPEPPALGVSEKEGGKIVTAMPGMILTIDQASFAKEKGEIFHRLYAPASGHTTQREARSCRSCHNNPQAIGFGRGELRFDASGGTGKWKFEPRFAHNAHDNLPEDSWTGFLKEARQPAATRTWLRPFTVAEQKKILEVGSCLTCHDEKSSVMERSLTDYEGTLAARKSTCTRIAWRGQPE